MYRFIYSLPLWLIIALMLIAVPLWALGQRREGQSLSSWRALNGALCILSLLVVVSVTVFRRSPRAGQVNLIPFSTFAMARAVPESAVAKMLERTVPPAPDEARTVEWICV